MGATVTVTLHDRHTIAIAFPFDAGLVAWLKECEGARWNPGLRCWLAPLAVLQALRLTYPAAQVADDAAEVAALNYVALPIANGCALHLGDDGRVQMVGEQVTPQIERDIERHAPALARIMRRQMAEKMALPNVSCVRPFEGAQ